jgi:hypothetical protein
LTSPIGSHPAGVTGEAPELREANDCEAEPASPDAPDGQRRGTVFLDYSNGGNRAYDIARILRDYLVRVEPGSDELLLGKACFVVAGTALAHS